MKRTTSACMMCAGFLFFPAFIVAADPSPPDRYLAAVRQFADNVLTHGRHTYDEFMWQVNADATRRFVESFWSSHIQNWSNVA